MFSGEIRSADQNKNRECCSRLKWDTWIRRKLPDPSWCLLPSERESPRKRVCRPRRHPSASSGECRPIVCRSNQCPRDKLQVRRSTRFGTRRTLTSFSHFPRTTLPFLLARWIYGWNTIRSCWRIGRSDRIVDEWKLVIYPFWRHIIPFCRSALRNFDRTYFGQPLHVADTLERPFWRTKRQN